MAAPLSLVYILLFCACVARQASGQFLANFAKNALQTAAGAVQQKLAQQLSAAGVSQAQVPSPAELQRIEAIQQVHQNQLSAGRTQNEVNELLNDYKKLEQDLTGPLTDKTATLKTERMSLMRRISTLTNEVRAAYDQLHPGSLDELEGIVSPCAAFHEEREAQKKELEVADKMDQYEEETRALNRMTAEERINYDRNMVEEYKAKKKDLQKSMKKAGA